MLTHSEYPSVLYSSKLSVYTVRLIRYFAVVSACLLAYVEVITEGTEANGLCGHPELSKAFFETFRRFSEIL